jgi:hypothetical protein
MENESAKSGSRAGRRIRWLAGAIVLAIAAYSGGWYWLAGKVETETRRAMQAQSAAGTDIDCEGLSVSGYPFRLEVRCKSVGVVRPMDRVTIRTGGFRSAAQVYEPTRIVAELDSPVSIDGGTASNLELGWRLGRASAVIGQPLPQRASVSVDELSAKAGAQPLLRAGHAEAHMRRNEGALDLAVRYDGLVLERVLTRGRELPVLAGDADLTVDDGVRMVVRGATSLRGVSGQLRRAALLVTPDRGVLVSGPFSVGNDGLIDATLKLTVVDPAGLAQAFKPAFPDYASQIEALAAAQPPAGDGEVPELTLPLVIREGMARIAFINLGHIPPVD